MKEEKYKILSGIYQVKLAPNAMKNLYKFGGWFTITEHIEKAKDYFTGQEFKFFVVKTEDPQWGEQLFFLFEKYGALSVAISDLAEKEVFPQLIYTGKRLNVTPPKLWTDVRDQFSSILLYK